MLTELQKRLNKPLKIGNRTIPNRLVLAPMTFLGHMAFRQVLDELGGCGLMFSEMCSAGRVPTEDRTESAYFRWRDDEAQRLSIQIVGNKPERMALAAQRIESEGLWGVDINLGCSAKAICKYNQGAALLKDIQEAVSLVKRVRQAVTCPLTVKFRTGWEDDPDIPVEFARRLEDIGIDALTFHPRVAPDRRNRSPKWEYIAMVKHAVSIPVFGNGDVFDAEDCLEMLNSTGCDGVALGRIAIAKPWLFAQWTQGHEPVSDVERAVPMRILELLIRYFDTKSAIRRFKRYSTYLAANYAFGNSLYNQLRNAADTDAFVLILNGFFDRKPQLRKRPNLNFMR